MTKPISIFCLLAWTMLLTSHAVAERGGNITVGKNSWTLVPAIQCSIYPGDIVNIAGHAEEDESLELVIDYGGPTGIRIGEGTDAWHARNESINIQIEGKRIQGDALFFQYTGSPEDDQQGSFDVSCI